jgi:hypothetical protein
MAGRHAITSFLALVAIACTACGGNKKEVESARHSLYDSDFALVYSQVLNATRELYPNIDDHPGTGRILTAWHQVTMASNGDDMANPRTLSQNQGVATGQSSPAAAMAGMPTRLAFKRYFIRFEVSVLGGRPWRVKVIGHASEWEPGAAMPVELHGAAKPPWLDGRTEALQLAIYRRMRRYAVPMKEEQKVDPDEQLPKADPKRFAALPEPAAKMVAALWNTLARRDYTALRPYLAEDVTWSLGGGTGADAAIATWQADPQTLDAMTQAIDAGCASDAARKVACPAGPAVAGKYQLVLEPRGSDWKVTSFVRGE